MFKKFALHGFLGRPDDWTFLKGVQSWDLFSEESLAQSSLEDWGQWFNLQTQDESPKILVAYSLGGRLGLHALIHNPKAWAGAVIISAHPGLTTVYEKAMRLEQDRNRSKKFLTEPWEILMEEWNRQPVLQSEPISRREQDYDRTALARALVQWSLGRQRDLRNEIAEMSLPILWITGEHDSKFQKLAESVTLSHPQSRFCIAPQAGHRVILSGKEFIRRQLAEFEASLSQKNVDNPEK